MNDTPPALTRHLSACLRTITLLALLMAALTPARALPVNVMGALYYQYIPGQTGGPVALEIEQGSSLTFTNLDPLGAHDVIAYDVDERGDPLFYAPPINSNEGTTVEGVEALAPGSYGFWCSVHGAELMSGELTIVPAALATR